MSTPVPYMKIGDKIKEITEGYSSKRSFSIRQKSEAIAMNIMGEANDTGLETCLDFSTVKPCHHLSFDKLSVRSNTEVQVKATMELIQKTLKVSTDIKDKAEGEFGAKVTMNYLKPAINASVMYNLLEPGKKAKGADACKMIISAASEFKNISFGTEIELNRLAPSAEVIKSVGVAACMKFQPMVLAVKSIFTRASEPSESIWKKFVARVNASLYSDLNDKVAVGAQFCFDSSNVMGMSVNVGAKVKLGNDTTVKGCVDTAGLVKTRLQHKMSENLTVAMSSEIDAKSTNSVASGLGFDFGFSF